MPTITFREPAEAFADAIRAGHLSREPDAANYAGRYLYMGTSADGDLFKHKMTREYLTANPANANVQPPLVILIASTAHATWILIPDTDHPR